MFVREGMLMDIWKNFTPEFFDTLVIVIIILGLALAVVRLYRDFTRPLPADEDVDTKPNLPAVQVDDHSSST
ncbi:MAG: hypothetical protein GC204_21615 [Chloroflexi bacterium]|nr:hypothetical protein [Chloroflexota bacterium]